jgi:hypothetical protein
MRKFLVAVVVLLLLPAGATAAQTTMLLTPSGQPVGGRWQRWIDRSYAPTLDGPMVLDFSRRSACQPGYDPPASKIAACTAGGTFTPVVAAVQADPETLINTVAMKGTTLAWRRWVLLYEQGHVIDFEYLTDAARSELLAMWRQPPLPADEQMAAYWWAGESNGRGRVYGEWFSEAYALCALYPRWNRAAYLNARRAGRADSYGARYPGWGATRQAVRAQTQTCRFIRNLTV